jgi:site-specific DNA-methyltransferase (adenine-specific)
MIDVNRFLTGDALARLRELPDASVDTCITSPPYLLLRNYGVAGQMGMEANAAEWAERLATVLNEVARVLKPTGSVWLNVSDGYARHVRHGAPPKSLLLAPERLLLRLQSDGWIVRNRVVWHKTNTRPSSVRDRLTCRWEPIYLLVRSRHYFFDLDVIRRPHRTPARAPRPARARRPIERAPAWVGPLADGTEWLQRLKALGSPGHPFGANPGDVLTTTASNFRGAHFATFPPAMVEPLLKATCPEKVCGNCGRAWEREPVRRLGQMAVLGRLRPGCECRAAAVPGLVLDPFSGAGTVALVAEAHKRRWLGIDLNPDYIRLAEDRLRAARAGPAARAA